MKRVSTKRLALTAVIFAIISVMAFVPQLGYVIILPGIGVSLNFLLIPVCVAAVVLSFYDGFAAGAYLGVTSLIMSYLSPGSVIDIIFQYPHVSILPRLFIGPAVYFSHKLFKKLLTASKKRYVRESLPVHIAASCGVLTNTVLVSLSLWITMAAMPVGVSMTGMLVGILAMNMSFEIAAVNLLVPPICAALKKAGFGKKAISNSNVTPDNTNTADESISDTEQLP